MSTALSALGTVEARKKIARCVKAKLNSKAKLHPKLQFEVAARKMSKHLRNEVIEKIWIAQINFYFRYFVGHSTMECSAAFVWLSAVKKNIKISCSTAVSCLGGVLSRSPCFRPLWLIRRVICKLINVTVRVPLFAFHCWRNFSFRFLLKMLMYREF